MCISHLPAPFNAILLKAPYSKVDHNEKTNSGWTALMSACSNGHLSVIQYLINVQGMDVEEKWNGRTAIDIASIQNHKAIVSFMKSGMLRKLIVILLLYCRFEYIICSQMSSCLNSTLIRKSELIKQLLETSHVSDKWWEDSASNDLMDICRKAVVQYLINDKCMNVKVQDNYGQTTLMYACNGGHLSVVEYLIIVKGMDVKEKDNADWSVVMYACQGGCLPVIEYLINVQGMDMMEKSSDGVTTLMAVCKEGHLSVVQYLIDANGMDVNEKDNDSQTALMAACQGGHLSVVQCLIGVKDLDVNAKDKYGDTTVDLYQIASIEPLSVI